jgi:hypothetical protein
VCFKDYQRECADMGWTRVPGQRSVDELHHNAGHQTRSVCDDVLVSVAADPG